MRSRGSGPRARRSCSRTATSRSPCTPRRRVTSVTAAIEGCSCPVPASTTRTSGPGAACGRDSWDARRTNPSPVPSGQVQTRRSWCRRASAWSSRWRRPRTRRRSPSASVVHSRRSTSGRHVVGTRSRPRAHPWTSSTTQERRSTSRASDRTAVTSNLTTAATTGPSTCRPGVVARFSSAPVPRGRRRVRRAPLPLLRRRRPLLAGDRTRLALSVRAGVGRASRARSLERYGQFLQAVARRPQSAARPRSARHDDGHRAAMRFLLTTASYARRDVVRPLVAHRAPHSEIVRMRLSAFGSFVRLLPDTLRARRAVSRA